jgi:hypothetical protein
MNKKWMIILAVMAAVMIGSCSWEMPEEVIFRAQPQLWVPTGSAVIDIDVADELNEIIGDFTTSVEASDPNLTAGEKPEQLGIYEGKPLTLFGELAIVAPTFSPIPPPLPPGYDVRFDDQTTQIDLSELSGPIPDEVLLKEVPGWAWFEPDPAAPAFTIFVRLEATWTDGGIPKSQYLLGDAGGLVSLAPARATDKDFDLAAIFNDRPADLVLHYEFGANSANVSDIDSVHLYFEVPFAFQVTTPALLDLEDNGDNPLLMEEDIFGRDPLEPDEDLDDLLDALRGSNAGISLTLTQTSGLGARLGMVNSKEGLSDAQKEDPTNWVIDVNIDPDEVDQTVDAQISEQALEQMIDGAGLDNLFIPEFLILVEEDFQINKLWTLTVTEGYLRVQAIVDYTFSLEEEE